MRRTVSALGLFLLCTATAAAEDFSGFYAGVNAGWAFESGGARDLSVPGAPGAPKPEEGLPPSVARVQERQLPAPAHPTGRR
ncbi:hypothetical protein [Methylorubrum extorquens]|uniref:hypothetical protein n=1 Tax=Methylorubrum extorquens TaxID=408 RepID=UPI00016297F9|nr:hypothetical protein [Methylorubrum extorquens]ABY31364.1 hypothetical protein Mext_2975 [Methylorubrum extorquens PA1]KQP86674.1 hypothetical protein ASF55_09650 [Methylobacterium sp. Leaf119]WIU38006.1 porin family protein [Methylorubrum extorquens]